MATRSLSALKEKIVEEKKIVKNDGKEIAEAANPKIAEDPAKKTDGPNVTHFRPLMCRRLGS